MFPKLALLLIQLIQIYSYMLLIWVIGSWFPKLRDTKFYYWIDRFVYPYAKIFRSVIPAFGGFDFSPIVAFIVLGILQNILGSLFLGSGI